jgi:hypothetical protein
MASAEYLHSHTQFSAGLNNGAFGLAEWAQLSSQWSLRAAGF